MAGKQAVGCLAFVAVGLIFAVEAVAFIMAVTWSLGCLWLPGRPEWLGATLLLVGPLGDAGFRR